MIRTDGWVGRIGTRRVESVPSAIHSSYGSTCSYYICIDIRTLI